jgi:protein TonB
MKYFLLSIGLFSAVQVSAQSNEDTLKKPTQTVEEKPSGSVDFLTYLAKNLRYPDDARENDIQGKVIVKFIVTETGDIDSVQVIKGIGGGCDEEAVRVIKNMPRWKPGTQKGKPVKVYFTQAITFNLEGRSRRNKKR